MPDSSPEVIEIGNEIELLEATYRVTKTITENDVHRMGLTLADVGTPYTTIPEYPDDPKLAFELFVNYHATIKFLILKRFFLQENKKWSVPAIEKELKKLDGFISSVHSEVPAHFTINNDRQDYLKLNSRYFENNPIEQNGNLDKVYAKYFLFHDFLIEKLYELYHGCAFSKLNPHEQLDTLLLLFNDIKRSKNNRMQLPKVQSELERNDVNIPIHLLSAMINQLVKDGYIEVVKLESFELPFYVISFTGRLFLLQGGYDAEVKTKNQERESINWNTTWMRRWSLIAAISAGCLVLIEVIKLLLGSFPPTFYLNVWLSGFMILFCLLMVVIVTLVIVEIKYKK